MTRFAARVAALLCAAPLSLVGCGRGPAPQAADLGVSPPTVLIETSHGNITVELFPDRAPMSVDNFLSYATAGFYDGTIFHRVIPGFMIQGGGLLADLHEKPTHPPIPNEAGNGLKNLRGTLAMARTDDPHSATAQFFINVADNAFLDHRDESIDGWGYAVFGRVVAGMEVVDAIAAVPRGSVGPHEDVPLTPVVIKHVTPAQ